MIVQDKNKANLRTLFLVKHVAEGALRIGKEHGNPETLKRINEILLDTKKELRKDTLELLCFKTYGETHYLSENKRYTKKIYDYPFSKEEKENFSNFELHILSEGWVVEETKIFVVDEQTIVYVFQRPARPFEFCKIFVDGKEVKL